MMEFRPPGQNSQVVLKLKLDITGEMELLVQVQETIHLNLMCYPIFSLEILW